MAYPLQSPLSCGEKNSPVREKGAFMWLRPAIQHIHSKKKLDIHSHEKAIERQGIVHTLLFLAGLQFFVTVFLMSFFSY